MKKTIVYLHPHFTAYGGAGRFVLESAQRLAARGYRIKIVSIKTEWNIIREYTGSIEFINIGGPLSSSIFFWLLFPLSCIKVSRVLGQCNDFILFPQVFPSNWWGAWYKIFHKKVPMVWMCQEPSAFINSREWIESIKDPFMRFGAKLLNPLLKYIDIKLAAVPDRVIVNSEYTRRYAQSVYNYSPVKATVVYIGVDLPELDDDIIKENVFTLVSVARLTKFKKLNILLDSVKLLCDRGYNIRLAIIGSGEEQGALARQAKSLKINDRVKFSGSVCREELDSQYRKSHLYISCAVQEPFGLAPIEAMSYGLPVVAVDSGGPAETVIDGETGYLIPGEQPNALAEKIAAVISDENLYKTLSVNARKRAEIYSWDGTIKAIEHIITRW